MNKMKWLHLSDIHYNMDNYESEWLRNNLIKTLSNQNEKIDMLIVTGDLLYQFKSSFNEVENFLKAIINAINISLENVFIVPGNHDFERSRNREWLIKGIKSNPINITDTVASLDEDVIDNLIDGQKEFWDFHERLLGHKDDYKSIHFVNLREKFNIINLNTCLISGTENEEGTLSINMKKLMMALKNIEDETKPNIAIGHHSLECFDLEEKEKIVNAFEDFNVDIYLCGHIHKNKCDIYTQGNRYIPSIVSGSNMIDSYATPSFNIGEINLDSSECKVKYYKWSKNRQWVVDSEVDRKIADDNTLNFTLSRLKKNLPSRVESDKFNKSVDKELKLKNIIEKVIKTNTNVSNQISIESSHEEIVNFFHYAIISSDFELKQKENVKDFMEYISCLKEQGFIDEFLENEIENILKINKVPTLVMEQSEWLIKLVFHDEGTMKALLHSLLEYYFKKTDSFKDGFGIYGNCVQHLCKYYKMFGNLFKFEREYIDTMIYAISNSGDYNNTYYDYDGLNKVRENISFLREELIFRLLEQFDVKQICTKEIISKQLIAIIEGYKFDEEMKRKLKFVYIDCKYIETLILEMIEEKLDEYYKEFYSVENDINENTFDKSKIVRIIEEKISKENSDNSIKCIAIIENLSKYNIMIQINEDDIHEIITILYSKNGKIVKVVCENKEILNFPYKFSTLGTKIKYNSKEYNKLEFKIRDRINVIQNSPNEEDDGMIKNIPRNHNWIDE